MSQSTSRERAQQHRCRVIDGRQLPHRLLDAGGRRVTVPSSLDVQHHADLIPTRTTACRARRLSPEKRSAAIPQGWPFAFRQRHPSAAWSMNERIEAQRLAAWLKPSPQADAVVFSLSEYDPRVDPSLQKHLAWGTALGAATRPENQPRNSVHVPCQTDAVCRYGTCRSVYPERNADSYV